MSDPHPLDRIADWGGTATAGYVDGTGRTHTAGPDHRIFEWASVTKLVTAMAVWVAIEEGTVGWDEPAGPPGSTMRHLLAHASGLAPDSDDVLSRPGRRRIYSNRGTEVAASHVAAAAGMPFGQYATEAVLEPLAMQGTSIGHPAWGAKGPLIDLISLGRELIEPTLVSRHTHAHATTVAFPGLSGVLPGFGSQPDNAWGLGPEIRAHKNPHWTGRLNSPQTFGHFGRSGSFLWVDPDSRLAVGSLTTEPFGSWATTAWPELSDAILAAVSPRPEAP